MAQRPSPLGTGVETSEVESVMIVVPVFLMINSLRGELSNNVMQALPVLRGSNTISSVHPVSVTPGPRPLFSSANPIDSSGSAPVATGTGSPAVTVKFCLLL